MQYQTATVNFYVSFCNLAVLQLQHQENTCILDFYLKGKNKIGKILALMVQKEDVEMSILVIQKAKIILCVLLLESHLLSQSLDFQVLLLAVQHPFSVANSIFPQGGFLSAVQDARCPGCYLTCPQLSCGGCSHHLEWSRIMSLMIALSAGSLRLGFP